MTEQQGKDEIEKGFSAVKMAIGANPSPFFRFPGLAHTQPTLDYLGTRNISMFSVDIDSLDFKSSSSDQVINTVMTKLDKQGKGIILMHDLQKHTAQALPTMLRRLKAGGYKVVRDEGQGAAGNPAGIRRAAGQGPEGAGRQRASALAAWCRRFRSKDVRLRRETQTSSCRACPASTSYIRKTRRGCRVKPGHDDVFACRAAYQ